MATEPSFFTTPVVTQISQRDFKLVHANGWSEQSIDRLLYAVDRHMPTDIPQWEYLACKYNNAPKSIKPQSAAVLRAKYEELVAMPIPTNTWVQPGTVQFARKLQLRMNNLYQPLKHNSGGSPSQAAAHKHQPLEQSSTAAPVAQHTTTSSADSTVAPPAVSSQSLLAADARAQTAAVWSDKMLERMLRILTRYTPYYDKDWDYIATTYNATTKTFAPQTAEALRDKLAELVSTQSAVTSFVQDARKIWQAIQDYSIPHRDCEARFPHIQHRPSTHMSQLTAAIGQAAQRSNNVVIATDSATKKRPHADVSSTAVSDVTSKRAHPDVSALQDCIKLQQQQIQTLQQQLRQVQQSAQFGSKQVQIQLDTVFEQLQQLNNAAVSKFLTASSLVSPSTA